MLETRDVHSSQCPLPVSRFSVPREEAVAFVKQLDRAGRLLLCTPHEVPKEDRIHLLAVFKTAEVDRTVWDRRRRNFKEVHLSGTGPLEVISCPSEDFVLFC